jgi:signal transduction histidine kinase
MRDWLKGPRGGLIALALVSLLVAGGLGWVTAAALRMEHEQLVDRAEAEHATQLRLALRALDGYVAPLLAREDSRPFDHFSTVYAPSLLLDNDAHPFNPGSIVQPSPLLDTLLPDWMSLHFQLDNLNGWQSPQVPSAALYAKLCKQDSSIRLDNVNDARCDLLRLMKEKLPAEETFPKTWEEVTTRLGQPTQTNRADRTVVLPQRNPDLQTNEIIVGGGGRQGNTANPEQQPNYPYNPKSREMLEQDIRQRWDIGQKIGPGEGTNSRSQRVNRDVALGTYPRNGEGLFGRGPAISTLGSQTFVYLGRMVPYWLVDTDGKDWLALLRLVKIEDRQICQGVVLDLPKLTADLKEQVADQFPNAQFYPVTLGNGSGEAPLNRLTSLPLQLDPGTVPAVHDPGWTTLRIGLALAWVAALFAIFAVGLGGWTLIDLSERRIRFVSAVTHELRTPLTTLRLYLEMLLDGLVRDEKTRNEYLATLHGEAERLNRLVNNVLDYSRLEKTKPNLLVAPVPVGTLLDQVQSAWAPRCTATEKELVVETLLPAETVLTTDGELVQQILGNLIDNACKYSRGADDRRLWIRARAESGRVVIEVEDRGPGVAPRERRCIFNAFQRGGNVDPSTGGVGLGLALAKRWAELLGGTLELAPASSEGGACFRLNLPV